jgi:aryl-alcohol dehydrogenase-like predicted oxidoreductase
MKMRVGDREVTRIGLGTNRLRKSPQNIAFIKAAVAAGVQMIDSAHLYTGGESEETIGAALSPFPDEVIVASKAGFGGAGHGRPEDIRAEIEDSLHRLRTDVIYLYYLHRVDSLTPIEESLAAIKDYQDRAKIRFIGLSEVSVEQIERARRVVTVAAVQNQYNLAERRYDAEVDYCTREGIPFVPFYPLRTDGGSAVREIARSHRATPEQVMLSWLLRRSPVMLPIPGTLSSEHLKENLGAFEVELTGAEWNRLSAHA